METAPYLSPRQYTILYQVFPGGRGEPARHHKQLVAHGHADGLAREDTAECPHATAAAGDGGGGDFSSFLFPVATRPRSPHPRRERKGETIEALDRLSDLLVGVGQKTASGEDPSSSLVFRFQGKTVKVVGKNLICFTAVQYAQLEAERSCTTSADSRRDEAGAIKPHQAYARNLCAKL